MFNVFQSQIYSQYIQIYGQWLLQNRVLNINSSQTNQNFENFEISQDNHFKKIEPNLSSPIQTSQQLVTLPKKLKKQKKIKKKNQNYKKNKKNKRKQRQCKPIRNNQNRNILPNSIHQIMSFVHKQHKSLPICQRIFNKFNPINEWTPKRYYSYQKGLRQKINYYLKQSSLRILCAVYSPTSQIYSLEEQHFYMKVARILAKYYITSQSVPLFLSSRRIAFPKKLQHLKNRRELMDKVNNIFCIN